MKAGQHRPSAPIVWFDPGLTTGVAVVALDAEWLLGAGSGDLVGFKRSVRSLWAEQYGRSPGTWDATKSRASHIVVPTVDTESLWGQSETVGGGELSPAHHTEIEIVRQCQDLLDLWPGAAWGYESFVPYGGIKTSDVYSPLRVAEMLTYSEVVYGERGRTPFTQTASMGKTTVPDDRARKAGVYLPGLPHATDALRHVLTFARRCRGDAIHAKAAAKLRASAWPGLFGPGGRMV